MLERFYESGRCVKKTVPPYGFTPLSGGEKFKTTMKSEIETECSWDGTYELAQACLAS
jgi:hypothetical protein